MSEQAALRSIESYKPWLASVGADVTAPWQLLMFGDGPELALELAELVARGPKRATAALPAEWTALGEALPKPGQRYIVHDWLGEPWALIENTRVDIMPLCNADDAFAYDEGEGDRTLAWWRNAHEAYFRRECPRFGLTFDWHMPVVFMRFRRLYPRPDPR